ncbi:MAG: IclR family transcriptional regulator [Actinomycetota bacterium]|nr:IclR family transcriptional regulator [Actinomycetota bacterium]MDQ2957889.1 IclR family transcriptional regulator [Actinomycetota bacterium]
MEANLGYGVLGKAFALLKAVESGATTSKELVASTGISRPTTYRLTAALQEQGLLARDGKGGWMLGAWLHELAAQAKDPLLVKAKPVMQRLHDETGESIQLYRQVGQVRVCIAAIEQATGLRDTVPLGKELTMSAGSGAQVLLAFGADSAAETPSDQPFGLAQLRKVQRRGWAESISQRVAGVASVSAPVHCADGSLLALCLSGPISRMTREPGKLFAAQVIRSAQLLSELL